MLNNTRISHRLSLLIIVFLTSMAGMSGLGIYELLKVERNYDVVSEDIYPNSLVIAQVRDALYRLAVLQRNHLLYNEATMRISQEDRMAGEVALVTEKLAEYEAKLLFEEYALFEDLQAAWIDYQSSHAQILSLSKQGLLEESTTLSLRQGEPAFRKITERMNDLTELNRMIASGVRKTAQTSSQQAKMFMVAIPIATAGIILFLSVVIVRSITRPLQGLGQVTSTL